MKASNNTAKRLSLFSAAGSTAAGVTADDRAAVEKLSFGVRRLCVSVKY